MKNNTNIILGGILIVIGAIALGLVNNWFSLDVSLRQISKFWPLLIILAGLAVMADSKRSVFNSASVLLIIIAIPLSVYNCTGSTYDKVSSKLNNGNYDFDVDINEDDSDFSYEENGSDSSTSGTDHKIYKVEKNPEVKNVELKISGGASQFIIEEASLNDVFIADTKHSGSSSFSLKDEISGSTQKINFKMKSPRNVKWNKNGMDRKVTFMLSTDPIWDINMEVGAGDVQYNLSKYKVSKLKVETGASNVNLKLGDLLNETKVDIESGVANIEIEVPKTVGCEIRVDGVLNSKDFVGFTKVKSGLYRTEGFDSASNKIYLDLESGVSSFTVKRY